MKSGDLEESPNKKLQNKSQKHTGFFFMSRKVKPDSCLILTGVGLNDA